MKKKKRKPSFYAKIYIPLIAALLLAAVFLIHYFGTREEPAQTTAAVQEETTETEPVTAAKVEAFPSGCKLCGIDIGGQTPSAALAKLVDAVNAYSLTVRMDGLTFPLTAQQLGLHYNTDFDLNDYLDALLSGTQDAFDGIEPVTADEATVGQALLAAYNSAREAEETPQKPAAKPPEETEEGEPESGTPGQSLVDREKAQERMLVDPTRAHLAIDTENAVFVAEDGTEGYHKDYGTAVAQIISAAGKLQPAVSTRSEFLFSEGEKKEESSRITDALKRANGYLDLAVTLSFTPPGSTEAKTVTIDRKTLATFLVVDSDGLSVTFDEDAIAAYCAEVGTPYSTTKYKTAQFMTTAGHYVDVQVTTAGQIADADILFTDVLEQLKKKQSGTVTAQYREAEVVEGEVVNFDGTYVEIDLTNQQVYFYQDGVQKMASSCVSGKVSDGHTTPEGVFKIFAKDTNRYLVGATYRSWVNFFMPFNGGIGLHDASWRSTFGGTRYLYNGSHGCINLPYDAAAELFDYVSIGTVVVVHGGRKSVEKDNRTFSGETYYEEEAGSPSFALNVGTDDGCALTYSSSDPSVCSVSADGIATPLKAGRAVITVEAPETDFYLPASLKITVVVTRAERQTEEEPEPTTPEETTPEETTPEETTPEETTPEETTPEETTPEETTPEKTTPEETTPEETTPEETTPEETPPEETTPEETTPEETTPEETPPGETSAEDTE